MIDKAASSDGQSDASSDTDISLPSNNSIANAETDDIGLNSDFFTAGIVYADMMNVNAADRAFDMYLQSTGAGAARGHMIFTLFYLSFFSFQASFYESVPFFTCF